jgi:hypothetical protein
VKTKALAALPQHFDGRHKDDGHDEENDGRRGDHRAYILAHPTEYLSRKGSLLRTCEKQRDDDLVERRHECKECSRSYSRRDDR